MITLNGNMLRSMGETFLKLGVRVKDMYKKSLETVNILIAINKFIEDTKKKDNFTDPNN